jgi:hypothetical protein
MYSHSDFPPLKNPVQEKGYNKDGSYDLVKSEYSYVRHIDDMTALFVRRFSKNSPLEVFAARPDGHASWGLFYDGMDWEFLRSAIEGVDIPSNTP